MSACSRILVVFFLAGFACANPTLRSVDGVVFSDGEARDVVAVVNDTHPCRLRHFADLSERVTRAIADARPFRSGDELAATSGVGPSTLRKLQRYADRVAVGR